MTFAVSKSQFDSDGKQHSLITVSDSAWIERAHALWKIKPLILNVGNCVIKALGYAEGLGLYQPKLAQLEKKITAMGFNIRDENELRRLAYQLVCTDGKISLELPLRISLTAMGHLHHFSSAQGLCFNLQFVHAAPQAPRIAADSLIHLKEFLADPGKKHEEYRTHNPHGTCQLITSELVAKIAGEIFQKYAEFAQFAKTPYLINVVTLSSGTQIITHKQAGFIDLYALLSKFYWKGSYKTVFLSLKIAKQITAAGLSTSEDPKESKKEVFFRKHAAISPLITPLYLDWSADSQHNLVHGWASRGTLQDVLLKPISIDVRDEIALQLLEKMHIFHQSAIHKDLNINNIIVDHSGSGLTVYINDLGGSALKTSEEDLKEVAVNAYNLAPELLNACVAKHGYFWDYLFEQPFSANAWELGERFQIGQIIAQIYIGTQPYGLLQNKEAIESKYPLRSIPFKEIRANYPACYSLDEFMTEIMIEELTAAYKKAFNRMHAKELSKFTVLIEATTAALTGSFKNEEQLLKEKDELAEQHFSNISLRANLEPYLEVEQEKVTALYRQAYKNMDFSCRNEIYEDLAKIIATSKKPIWELVPDLVARSSGRLNPILPLLDLDPAKRPPLSEIHSQLKTLLGR